MSEFDLTISHVPGKVNIIAGALSRYCDLDFTNVAAVMMSTESDLLDTNRHAQEQDQTISFKGLKEQALGNERGMCIHEGLVYR